MSFRRITKLNVHIAKCQTHITYANDATRLLTNNPSGFAFRSMGTTNCNCGGDSSTQTKYFFQRHFGKSGSIERSPSLDNFLVELGVSLSMDNEAEKQSERLEERQKEVVQQEQQDEVQAKTQEDVQEDAQEDIEKDELEEAKEEALKEEQSLLEKIEHRSELELYTWHLEELPKVLPQLATKTEWQEEQLQISNCAWHLQNCNWRNLQPANCQCHKVKETMEHIKASMSEKEDKVDLQQNSKKSNSSIPDVNANIMNLNELLQQLNNLLEQQNKKKADVSSSV